MLGMRARKLGDSGPNACTSLLLLSASDDFKERGDSQ